MKVAFFPNNNGFCAYYRMIYPATTLQRAGLAETKIINQENIAEVADACFWADVMVFQSGTPFEFVQGVVTIIANDRLEKIVVCDLDDNLFDVQPCNDAYKNWGTANVYANNKEVTLWKDGVGDFNIERNKNNQKELSKTMAAVDIVTTTGKHLQKELQQYNPNTFVIKNCIDPTMMPVGIPLPTPDQVVIGWQGGDSHYFDLIRVWPEIKKIKKDYGDKVHFRFFGANFHELYAEIDGEFIHWIKPNLFFERFSKKLFDIGIIPLESNNFNRCKSNIKWLEYSYYKIPSVVASVDPYRDYIKDNADGFLYSDNAEFSRKLRKLIDVPLLRKAMAESAHAEVMENWTVQKNIMDWYNLYSGFLDAKKLSLKTLI